MALITCMRKLRLIGWPDAAVATMQQLMLLQLLLSLWWSGAYAGYEKRPYYFPIFPQPQHYYYEAGFHDTYGGVSALYRNDQRQEYVNNLAHQHGTGLGTAPWYGVPGTAYDFSHGHVGGSGYGGYAHSHPTGYGYQASVQGYHSQPYGHGHGGHGR